MAKARWLTREEVQRIKAEYPAGTRICLDHMDDPYDPVPDGTCGSVTMVDDQGQIFMKWNNGRTLALNTDIDTFHKI